MFSLDQVVFALTADDTQTTPGVTHGSAARTGVANAQKTLTRISSAENNKADGRRFDLIENIRRSCATIQINDAKMLVVPIEKSTNKMMALSVNVPALY
jgi:hypothetical protein